ncbi:MAG: RecX family transcriptional regulator [Oscillospiraceae bacterium]|nr:RecX family transcriptional regulator [Oscillospiraceae bacterium]
MRFDDGTVMRLYPQTVQDFYLYADKELSDEQMTALRTAAGAMSAKMRAVRIVASTAVSKKDLEQRLIQKGEDPDQAKDAVQWMSDMKLVDDRAVAEQIVNRCISKGYGLARAKQALYEKRIPKQYWEEALSEYPDQQEAIVSFLRTKLGQSKNNRDLKKVIDALIRRGHSYGQVRKAMTVLGLDPIEFWEE